MTSNRLRAVGLAVATSVAFGLAAPPATAAGGSVSGHTGRPTTDERLVRESKALRKHVTLAGVRAHQKALQRIADANGGTRVAGSPGFTQSVAYVVRKAKAAGLKVSTQDFEFVYNVDEKPPALEAVAPSAVTFTPGRDLASMTYSADGDVTAVVVPVDVVEPPGAAGSSTSGCEAADFAGFPAGAVALLQRGTCSFAVKATNAQAAGAAAVVVYNEGQPGRTAVIAGTLGTPGVVSVPVIGVTYAAGRTLAAAGTVARVAVDRIAETRIATNVIGDTRRGDPNHTVVVGAHLDSVLAGPGINDNGSGSAGILEIAEALQKVERHPTNRVRFAWWGAEEFGLLGSEHYVDTLTAEQKAQLVLNLNFDMIGSPNYVRFVYDGDNSTFGADSGAAEGPAGSGRIEQVFHNYFGTQRLASAETPFSGRSDYGPFIAAGIPAGGLFTGAEGEKTAAEAAVFGGTAGAAYDACYHQACDTFANNNLRALDEMSDAAAHAVHVFAEQNFTKNPLTDPEGPVGPVSGPAAGGGGGGLHDDHDLVES